MSLDPSLKLKNKLAGVRNVMTRAERMERLSKDKRFDPKRDSVLGLPKTKRVEK
jgi:small basic protein (TIGR04137 family)